jgi:hypothetical protein
MKAKHTPGPWTLTADGAGWYIECSPERGHSVAYIRAEIGEEDPDTSDDEKEANARLIAAAPELLEALIALLGVAPSKAPGAGLIVGAEEKHANALQAARAAIKKATGDA